MGPPPPLSAGCQRLRALSRSPTGGTSTQPHAKEQRDLTAVHHSAFEQSIQAALQGPDT
jgi:hypothetical protein